MRTPSASATHGSEAPPGSLGTKRSAAPAATSAWDERREQEAILEAAERLANLRGWTYDVATGQLQWASAQRQTSSFPGEDLEHPGWRALAERVHPDDRAALAKLARQVLAGLTPFSFRFRYVGKGGQQRAVAGNGESHLGPDGTVRRLCGAVMDVTEQERRSEAEELARARLRSLADSATVWWWEQDDQFRFTFFSETTNEGQARIHAAALGRRRWELPECVPCRGTWEDHRELLAARKPYQDFEFRVGLGESTRFLSATGLPRFSSDGDFLGYRGTGHDITDLKTAQETARQTEALLHLASRLGRIGAWALELPEMKGSWSSELLNIYEFAPDAEITPELLVSLVHPDWRTSVSDAMQACHKQGVPVDVEFKSLTAKGRSVWLRITAEVVRDAAGNIVRMQGAVQDITDRKEDAERLRLLSEQLTTTFESITDAFLTVDWDLRLTYVNGVAERASRLPREQLLGKLLSEQFPTFSGSEFHREFERALAEGTAGRVEAYARAFRRWLNVTVYPSAQGLTLFVRDVTASRNAQQALVHSEERYRMLFETSADGILKMAPDGRIRRANRAVCVMFGRSEQQMQELRARELVSPADGRLEGLIRQRQQQGRAFGELTMLRADGSVFEAEVSTSTFRNQEGAEFVNIVIRDATERIQLRQKLQSVNTELVERVRQRTLDLERANGELRGFARSLAHDLRQPLSAIKAFSFALDDALNKEQTEKARQYGGQITAAAQLMGQYVEAVLSLARVSQARLDVAEVDLSSIAMDLLDQLHAQHPARQVLAYVQPGLRARGDATLLRLLLQNLLGNAWKFTGQRKVSQITLTAAAGDDGVVVYSVQDDGAGFDMARAERLFATFERLHKQADFPGTGIGLATAQKIVFRHGGRIWAESRVGEGATFHFTLGKQPPAGEAPPA